jgi:hypothetical protein
MGEHEEVCANDGTIRKLVSATFDLLKLLQQCFIPRLFISKQLLWSTLHSGTPYVTDISSCLNLIQRFVYTTSMTTSVTTSAQLPDTKAPNSRATQVPTSYPHATAHTATAAQHPVCQYFRSQGVQSGCLPILTLQSRPVWLDLAPIRQNLCHNPAPTQGAYAERLLPRPRAMIGQCTFAGGSLVGNWWSAYVCQSFRGGWGIGGQGRWCRDGVSGFVFGETLYVQIGRDDCWGF